MRRNWKRITGIVLAFVLIIGQFMAGVSQTQAASKSPKLSRASLTLTVGQSRKLSVSNAKNATVDDGLFSTNSSRITDYINQKVLEK